MTIQRQWTCKLCGWINGADAKACFACEKLRPRKKKERLPQAEDFLDCVVLGLDTATCSGWAIRDRGKLIVYGEHNLYTEIGLIETEKVIAECIASSYHDRPTRARPIVVVSERSWGGHMGRGETKAFGYWLHALLSQRIPYRRIVQAYPSQWRAVVLPKGGATAEREDVRRAEQALAIELTNDPNIGGDASAAVLISLWGAKAGEIKAVI
jgi:hypothetical protein